jgi:site-specific DNA-adenine methylase
MSRKILKEVLYDYNLFGEREDVVSAEGLPYLGNKGKLFPWILTAIERDRGRLEDKVGIPFCGGGSDAIGFARNGYTVKSNDLNEGVVDLLRRITKGDDLPRLFAKQFIGKEFFEELKMRKDWMGAYARAYYSFRSIGQTYLFANNRTSEKEHRTLWNAAVWGTDEYIKEWQDVAAKKGYQPLPQGIPTASWLKENMGNIPMIFYGLQLDKFRLQNPEKVEWRTGDYQSQDWSDCNFLYCDPPYKTATGVEYRETVGKVGGFDYERFWKWAKDIGGEKDVYVSEQTVTDDKIEVIAETATGVSLSSNNCGRKLRKEYLLKIKK